MTSPETTNHLQTIAESSDLIGLLRASESLANTMSRTSRPDAMLRSLIELGEVDTFATLAAIESLAKLGHTAADNLLADYLEHPVEVVRRHAAWRLGSRPPMTETYQRLVRRLTVGGIETMHAHRTLRTWSDFDPAAITDVIVTELEWSSAPAARARLVDTLGVIDQPDVVDHLMRIAQDPQEAQASRIAAVRALGQRPAGQVEPALRAIAEDDDEVGVNAVIAIDDLTLATRLNPPSDSEGLRVAQLTLAGELDSQLSNGGKGDTGGVASLLVSLGEALARRDDVAHVLTIGRGSATDVVADQLLLDDGKLSYSSLNFGDQTRTADSPGDSWEHLPTIRRGIYRVLRDQPDVDLLHLRMSDVGTLAGTEAAAQLGIDTCFSLAPDPHSVIQSKQDQGNLDRQTFVEFATTDHVWFRARLVERLARDTPRLALFPRSKPHHFFDAPADGASKVERDDHGDPQAERHVVVVPEGIDLRLSERATQLLDGRERAGQPGLPILDELAAEIPDDRQHLPLLVSVGRLNPIKGMSRVAAAWAGDPQLYESCTLVIVGGSLTDPSPTELSVLDAIQRAVPKSSPAHSGLVLLGGRPRQDVALILAAAVTGHPGGWAEGGTYVDGAYKEEFGLALIEAMAAGLVVTAPNVGGPPTYVWDGETGVLVDPDDDLGPALNKAFSLVDRPGRVERVQRLVRACYSVDTVAERLTKLYAPEPALL